MEMDEKITDVDLRKYYIPFIPDMKPLKKENITAINRVTEVYIRENFNYIVMNYKIYKIDKISLIPISDTSNRKWEVIVYCEESGYYHSMIIKTINNYFILTAKDLNRNRFYVYKTIEDAAMTFNAEYQYDKGLLEKYKKAYESKLRDIEKMRTLIDLYPEYMI
jgi:hypothetical protein